MPPPPPPQPLRHNLPIRQPHDPRQERRALGVQERQALHLLPPLLICGIVRLQPPTTLTLSLYSPLGKLRIHQEHAAPQINILAQVLLVAVVQADGGQPRAAPQAEPDARLGELAGEQAPERGPHELGAHVPRQEKGRGEAVPVLAEADRVARARDVRGRERGVDGKRGVVARVQAPDAGEAEVDGREERQGDGGELELGGDAADDGRGFWVGAAEEGEEDVQSEGGVEGEEGVGRVHEALLLVRLAGEDGEPEVEGGEEDEGAQAGLEGGAGGVAGGKLLEEEEREGEEGEEEPDVKVEEEVLEVEGPGLRAVEVGAAGGGEDVVLDDVPGDDLDLFVKEGVYGCVEGLGTVLSGDRLEKETGGEDVPLRRELQQHHG